MWWLNGCAANLWGRGTGFETGISHNDPDVLQVHCILYNTVEHFRVERETYPWGKTRSKKPNWSERDKCEKAEKAFINDIFYFRKGPHIGCSVWCGWVCGGAGAGVPGGAPHPQDLYPLQLLPAPPGSVQQVLERKKTRQIKKSTVYLHVGFCFVIF